MGAGCCCCAAETAAVDTFNERDEAKRPVPVGEPKERPAPYSQKYEREEAVKEIFTQILIREGDISRAEAEERRKIQELFRNGRHLIADNASARMTIYHYDGDAVSSDDDGDVSKLFGVVPLVTTSDPHYEPGLCVDLESNNSMLMADLSATFSEKGEDLSRVSSKKSLIGDGHRNDLLSRKPLLGLELNEVSDRDHIQREAAEVLTRMRTHCLYISTIHTLRMVVHPALEDAHVRLLASATEAEEIKHRHDLESRWLREVMPIYDSLGRLAVGRAEFFRDKMGMELRQKRIDAAKKVEREEARKLDKMKWEAERARLDSAKVSALNKLRADLTRVREAAGHSSFQSAQMGRNTKALRRKCMTLEDDEDRARVVVDLEENDAFIKMHDKCAREAPSIVAHPNRDIYQAQKDAELSNLLQLKRRLESRLKQEEFAKAEKVRMTAEEFTKGRIVSLLRNEDRIRMELVNPETTEWASLAEKEAADRIIIDAHVKRRRVRAREQWRDDREEARFEESHKMICRVGRGYMGRCRIGAVYPVKEDVLRILHKEERARKHIKQREHIAQGDLLHFSILEARLAFPYSSDVGGTMSCNAAEEDSRSTNITAGTLGDSSSPTKKVARLNSTISSCTAQSVSWEVAIMFPKCGAGEYPWDPSVTEPVEEMARDKILKEFMESYIEKIQLPAALGVEEIKHLPLHMVGARERSARKIQAKFRGFINKRNFVENEMDEMVLTKMARLQRKSEMRLFFEIERKKRFEITLEYDALGLHRHATLEEFFDRWRKETRAAINIQRVFRGYRHRRYSLDDATLLFLRGKWTKIKEWMAEGAPAGYSVLSKGSPYNIPPLPSSSSCTNAYTRRRLHSADKKNPAAPRPSDSQNSLTTASAASTTL